MSSRCAAIGVFLLALGAASPARVMAQDFPEEEPAQEANRQEDDDAPDTEAPEMLVDVESAPPEVTAAPAAEAEPAAPAAQVNELEDRLFDIEERLDLVERDGVLDSLHLSGDYRTIFNTVHYRGPTPNQFDRLLPTDAVTREITGTNEEIWSHRLRINILAEPVPSVRVTARLVMYKIFGDGDAAPFIQDNQTTRLPRDSGMRLDQVWIDWFMFDWLALSAGRIAYSEGNPAELRENSTTRRATWGVHMVDGEYDTINATIDLTSLVDNWYIRFFYASWFNDNDQDVFGGFPFLSSGTDNLRIFGGNLDISIPGVDRNFLQLGYYIVPRFRPFFVPIPDPGFDPEADYTRAPAPLNGSLLFPSHMPDSLGGYMNGSALLELYDLGSSGLDLFLSGSVGYLEPNGEGISYLIPSDPTVLNSPRQEFPFLFLASQGDAQRFTYFVYAGLRYTIPIEAINSPKLGFEYNYGSRFHISFATQTDQLLTKLATRGSAFEGYFILPINEHLFMRASYLYIRAEHPSGFFGPNPAVFGSTSPDIDAETHSFSFVLAAEI